MSLPVPAEIIADIDSKNQDSPSVISEKERKFVNEFQENAIQSETMYAHLDGVKDHYKQKRIWSTFLMCAIGGMLLFQSVLLVVVGAEYLDYSKYEWLLPVLLVQNLAQVIGLAVWAVKYLFSDIR
jgi:hypothetical protein